MKTEGGFITVLFFRYMKDSTRVMSKYKILCDT